MLKDYKYAPIFAKDSQKVITIGEVEDSCRPKTYKAETNDVISFPNYEDVVIKRTESPVIDEGGSMERQYLSYFASVIRNNRPDWLLIKRICVYKHLPKTCAYSLTSRFNYCSDNVTEMLTFLGDLKRPITVLNNGITW